MSEAPEIRWGDREGEEFKTAPSKRVPRRNLAHFSDMKVTVSAEMKVNLGDYESADTSIILSGIPIGATDEEIEEALSTAKVTFDHIRKHLRERVKIMRASGRDWRDEGYE